MFGGNRVIPLSACTKDALSVAALTEDILALLDKIPIWKRVQEAPRRIDELEKRVAELEGRLAKAPGQACPRCGELAFRVSSSVPSKGPFAALGGKDVTRKCGVCNFEDTTLQTPS
jgi:hypothetical protein